MDEKKDISHISKAIGRLSMVTQFGISLVVPLLLAIWICNWLIANTGAGEWIYIIGIAVGLGTSFMVAYNFCMAEIKRAKKSKDKKGKTVSFNRHI